MAVKRVLKPLTIPQATSQARRLLDKHMPNVLTTAESRYSHDLATDTPLVITTITFPAGHTATTDLKVALQALAGVREVSGSYCRYVVTRAR